MLRKVSDLEGNYLDAIKGADLYGANDEKLGTADDGLVDESSGEEQPPDSGWLRSH